jgi:hypothetical protein
VNTAAMRSIGEDNCVGPCDPSSASDCQPIAVVCVSACVCGFGGMKLLRCSTFIFPPTILLYYTTFPQAHKVDVIYALSQAGAKARVCRVIMVSVPCNNTSSDGSSVYCIRRPGAAPTVMQILRCWRSICPLSSQRRQFW